MTLLNVKNRTLFTHDNLQVMRGINSETIDLIYLDPPFNSKRNYAAPIGSQAAGAAFSDTWSLDDIKKEWVETLETENKALWAAITAAGYISGESMQAYLTYMAIRLIEMKRILKPTGSIYLHCDPTASHYLKIVMDSLFGKKNFRNEIVWHYSGWNARLKKAFSSRHDTILLHGNSANHKFNSYALDWESEEEYICVRKQKVHTDDAGRKYVLSDGGGGTRVRRYLEEAMAYGKPVDDVWDIPKINGSSKERTGYPTQKPLALLERIIKASSNPGDIVLDPFCGCATTCIAAEKLNRGWIGIDIEEKARALVIERLHKEIYNDALLKGGPLPAITHRKSPPNRTEPNVPIRSPNIKQILYDKQKGKCAAPCLDGKIGREFPIDIFEIDHINPRSKGGQDVDSNLQLLCPPCNRKKGNKTMTHLMELLEEGMI